MARKLWLGLDTHKDTNVGRREALEILMVMIPVGAMQCETPNVCKVTYHRPGTICAGEALRPGRTAPLVPGGAVPTERLKPRTVKEMQKALDASRLEPGTTRVVEVDGARGARVRGAEEPGANLAVSVLGAGSELDLESGRISVDFDSCWLNVLKVERGATASVTVGADRKVTVYVRSGGYVEVEASTQRMMLVMADGARAVLHGEYAAETYVVGSPGKYELERLTAKEWTDRQVQSTPINGFVDCGGLFSGGTSMGDGQVGEDHERQYKRQLDDGTWLVVRETFAAMDLCVGHGKMEDDDECPEGCTEGQFGWDQRTEYVVCVDPADPGSTELRSDITNGPGSLRAYDTAEAADAAAREAANVDARASLMDSNDPNDW